MHDGTWLSFLVNEPRRRDCTSDTIQLHGTRRFLHIGRFGNGLQTKDEWPPGEGSYLYHLYHDIVPGIWHQFAENEAEEAWMVIRPSEIRQGNGLLDIAGRQTAVGGSG